MRCTAGLIVFMALLFSIAEGVVASLCAPMQGMPQATEVASAHGSGDSTPMAASSECDNGSVDPDANDGELPCPFGPYASSQGCTSAASLPANCGEIRAGTTGGRLLTAFTSLTHENLLVARLYHPPKA